MINISNLKLVSTFYRKDFYPPNRGNDHFNCNQFDKLLAKICFYKYNDFILKQVFFYPKISFKYAYNLRDYAGYVIEDYSSSYVFSLYKVLPYLSTDLKASYNYQTKFFEDHLDSFYGYDDILISEKNMKKSKN